ncbi:MAG TPA: aminotransferase class III-fold pyridoxal phosphate-dependent enzyme, partial [Myxococcaceae bacterium]|nr:aminotransferase class III-fold pyridoxal phosphate-dependent enzyme [Myxococcaceae bacterium]
TQFTSAATEALAARLSALAPTGDWRTTFLSGGSEAVEAAVKFARQLWVERGQPSRTRFIARVPSYHGNTLFALSLSGRPHYKKWYGPLLSEVVTTPAPHAYRSGLADYARDGAEHYAQCLEAAIQQAGPETVAAFIAEPVIGSSAGAALPPPGYFARAAEVCRRHGVLLISDEILCGAGRTGRFFAGDHFGVEPDLLVLGKGLGAGYASLSALMVRRALVDEVKAGSGNFMHAQTYMSMPSMTAAGVAVLDYFEKYGLVENAARMGERLQRRLFETLLPLPLVGNVSGLGLLAGVELVEDKTSRRPFPRARKVAEAVTAACFDHGLTVWPNVGHVDGVDGDLINLGPPLVIDEGEVDTLVDRLAQSILHTARSL